MATSTFPRGAKTALATVSVPKPGLYLLSMHNLPDNRLTPDFIKHALLPALDDIEYNFRKDFKKGDRAAALVLTGERVKNKFFSNGLQLEVVAQTPGFFKYYYYRLMERLLTFPMHTVSAINGHCFAGGFCLTQTTDWRVMRKERAWCCMNEVDFGAPLPSGMHSVLYNRLSPLTYRKVMLTAHRFTAPEALAHGIVDEIVDGDGEAVISRALAIAEENMKHSESGVLGLMKKQMYTDIVQGLQADDALPEVTMQELLEDRFKFLQQAVASAKL